MEGVDPVPQRGTSEVTVTVTVTVTLSPLASEVTVTVTVAVAVAVTVTAPLALSPLAPISEDRFRISDVRIAPPWPPLGLFVPS